MRIYLAMAAFLFHQAFAFAASPAAETAEAERREAVAEYAEFERGRSRADAEHAERVARLRAEWKSLSEEILRERKRAAEISAMASEAGKVSADSERISASASALEAALGRAPGYSPALKSSVERFARAADEAGLALLSPERSGAEAEVEDSSGAKVRGEVFRVGAFKYFIGDGRAGMVSDDFRLYGEDFSDMIYSFRRGEGSELPADLSGGKFMRSQFGPRGIVGEIRAGGIWMYPILFFGVISLLVCAFKIPFLFGLGRLDKSALQRAFASLDGGDAERSKTLCAAVGQPYGPMLERLLAARNLGAPQLEELSYEYMLEAGSRLFSGLSVLSVTAAVAPLFGLLGTVTGIIKTFGGLSLHGAQQAQSISAGISEALITTEYGLVVAIPAFVAHALLSRRAKAVMSDMEKAASAFIGKVS